MCSRAYLRKCKSLCWKQETNLEQNTEKKRIKLYILFAGYSRLIAAAAAAAVCGSICAFGMDVRSR